MALYLSLLANVTNLRTVPQDSAQSLYSFRDRLKIDLRLPCHRPASSWPIMSYSTLYFVFGGWAAYLAATTIFLIRRPILCFWFQVFFSGGVIWRGADLFGNTFEECTQPGPLHGYTVQCLGDSIRTTSFWALFAVIGLSVGFYFEARSTRSKVTEELLERPAPVAKETC